MSDVRPACTMEKHEALKVDPSFRTHADYIGTQVAGDLRIELRQCPLCGSTLGVASTTGKTEPPRTRGVSLRGQRCILIVDDDAAIREALREALVDEGYSVLEAEDGRRGLDLLTNARPSLVLLDLYMPELDGYHFVKEMRREPRLASIPVIAMSAAAPAVWPPGAIEFLTKPFPLSELLKTIARHVK